MRGRRLLVAIAVLSLVSAALVGVGVAQEDSKEGQNYSLDELSRHGQQIEGADPSKRYLGDRGSVFVSYRETNLIKELGPPEPEWAVDKVVTPGQTIDTTEVTMHFSRTRAAGPEEINVHVVTWERKTRRVEDGNVTRSEPYAANVSEQVHEVSISGGADRATIDLPTADEKRMVTIWIEEYPNARWVAPQKTVATAYTLPFGATWGSFLPWFSIRFFGLLAVGIPVAIGAAIKTVEKYGSGPGKGAAWWVVVGGLAFYFAGYFALPSLAALIVSTPVVIGLSLVVLTYLAAVEFVDPTRKVLVEKLTTEDVENALGEGVPDIEYETGKTLHVVDLDDNSIAFVKKGSLRTFFSIVLGAKPPTMEKSELSTRVRYEGDVADEKYYAESAGDELLSITWPSISIGASSLKKTTEVEEDDAPEIDVEAGESSASTRTVEREVWDRDRVSTSIMAFGVGTLIAFAALGNASTAAAVGTIPLVVSLAERNDGSVEYVPAPVHATPAKASRITEERELTIATTFEEIEEAIADMEADAHERALDIAESYVSRSRDRMDRLLAGGGEDPDDSPRRTRNGSSRGALKGDRHD